MKPLAVDVPRRLVAIASLLVLSLLLLASASMAKAATIGGTFTPGVSCSGGYTFVQSVSPSNQYAAPSSGTLTSWSFQAAGAPPQLKLKIARPVGGNDFRIVGESLPQTPVANVLNTYPVSIPVKAGDVLGFYTVTGGECGNFTAGYLDHYVNADVAVGSTATFTPGAGLRLDVSAIFKAPPPVPTCDGRKATIVAKPGRDTFGTEHSDVIVGTSGRDEIVGREGNDRICGRGGNDEIDGNRGADRLFGQGGSDKIDGGPGDDFCSGGPGRDRITRCGD
jgi:Ca2+-binding RTX toxin-like protein